MTPMFRHTVFLESDNSDAEAVITEACLALKPIAAARDIQFSYVGSEKRANEAIMHKIVDVMDDLARVDLIVDGSVPSSYLVITATTDDLGTEMLSSLQQRIRTLTTAQLLKQAAPEHATPAALIALGIGLNGVVSPEAQQTLEDGLKNPDVEIRYGAAVGASFLRSAELAEALGQAANAEPDESVAQVMNEAQRLCLRST